MLHGRELSGYIILVELLDFFFNFLLSTGCALISSATCCLGRCVPLHYLTTG